MEGVSGGEVCFVLVQLNVLLLFHSFEEADLALGGYTLTNQRILYFSDSWRVTNQATLGCRCGYPCCFCLIFLRVHTCVDQENISCRSLRLGYDLVTIN